MLQRYELNKRIIKSKVLKFVASSVKASAKLRKSANYRHYQNQGWSDAEILEMFQGKFTVVPAWEQFLGTVPDDIEDWARKVTGSSEFSHVVVHRIVDDVPRHVDKMNEECYVIPIQFDEDVALFEDSKMIKFEPGFFYSLNDYNEHGLKNPNKSEVIIITVA